MKSIDFVAIDFETATANRMACQVGIVKVENGIMVEKYCSLIQPPRNTYNPQTIRIHHITPEHTKYCLTFDAVWKNIKNYFDTPHIVAHNANFDADVLYQNLSYYNIPYEKIGDFVCTYQIYGLGLADLCKEFGMPDDGHHDALFDAECCAQFYINHLKGISPEQFLKEKEIIPTGYHDKITGDVLQKDLSTADPNNPFYDKKVVITGLFDVERKKLARILKSMGADIDTSVSKRTNIVLIGSDPGPKKLEQIETYNNSGSNIYKMYEKELMQIIGSTAATSSGESRTFSQPKEAVC